MQDVCQQLHSVFGEGEHAWKHAVGVWVYALALDVNANIEGTPHKDPAYDAEVQVLIVAIMMHVHLVRSWKGPGPAPPPPPELMKRISRTSAELTVDTVIQVHRLVECTHHIRSRRISHLISAYFTYDTSAPPVTGVVKRV